MHFGAGLLASRSFYLPRIVQLINSQLSKVACARKVHNRMFFLDPSVTENPSIYFPIITLPSHTGHHSDTSHRNTVIIPYRFTLVWMPNPIYPFFWSRMKEPCTFPITIVTVRVLTTHILVSTLRSKLSGGDYLNSAKIKRNALESIC